MRIVMPEIVPHSFSHGYLAMGRFERGGGGNAHYHGFSVGKPGPKVERVVADVEGVGDVPPRTADCDVRWVLPDWTSSSRSWVASRI